MLPHTVSCASAETSKSVRMIVITFALPPLRTKNMRILKILLIKMVSDGLKAKNCPFSNWDIFNVAIDTSNSWKDSRSWTYRSRGIHFKLDDQQKVRYVDTFPPEKQ